MNGYFKKTTPLWSREQFMTFEPEFRVAAVLSDGQWYNPDKIKTLVKIKDDDTMASIISDLMDKDAITTDNGGISYRMSLKQLETWRKSNGIPIEAQLIDKILYPRIFGRGTHRMTETELFLSAPLRKIGICTFQLAIGADINEIKHEMGYIGRFRKQDTKHEEIGGEYHGDTYRIYCLSSDCVREKLKTFEESHGGQGTMFAKISSFNMSNRREINQLNDEAIAELVRFYVKFSVVLVPAIKKTINTYLESSAQGNENDKQRTDDDGEALLTAWILNLVQRFDESICRPFSVYLMRVLPRQSYNYANNEIGKTINKFQLEKNKAIKRLRKNTDGNESIEYYDDNQVWAEMSAEDNDYDISFAQYVDMNSQLRVWQSTRKTTTLQWDGTNEEKQTGNSEPSVEYIMENDSTIDDAERSNRVQNAVIIAANDTGDYTSALIILRLLSGHRTLANALMSDLSSCISDGFKESLAAAMTVTSYSG
jgi:hypothetical protein